MLLKNNNKGSKIKWSTLTQLIFAEKFEQELETIYEENESDLTDDDNQSEAVNDYIGECSFPCPMMLEWCAKVYQSIR